MAREKFQTLTESMYYILLSLLEENCGVDIMKIANDISNGRLVVGPGTLYTLLDKFENAGMIKQTTSAGRKKSYIITSYGKEMLENEYNRLKQMAYDGKTLMEGE